MSSLPPTHSKFQPACLYEFQKMSPHTPFCLFQPHLIFGTRVYIYSNCEYMRGSYNKPMSNSVLYGLFRLDFYNTQNILSFFFYYNFLIFRKTIQSIQTRNGCGTPIEPYRNQGSPRI